MRTGRRVENYVELSPPSLGAVRLPASESRGRQRAGAELVHATIELKKRCGPASYVVASALSDAVIALVVELIGHDLRAHRARLSEAAHFGGLLAVAEEAGERCAPELTESRADTALACVQSQFSDPDQLAEQLTRWSLESGYFLVRSGGSAQVLLASLRSDLVRLLDGLEELRLPQQRRPTVPRPAPAPAAESLARSRR